MSEPQSPVRRSLIGWFAGNPIAANLLMIVLLAFGALSLWQMRMELFPEIDANLITVTVPYAGATPEEVEQGVVRRVEEAIAGIAGVGRLRATADEGVGTVIAEVDEHADQRRVLDEIRSEIDRITTMPEQAERPIITEITNRTPVITVAVFGAVPEQTLKQLAQRVQDDLSAKANITQIEMVGARPYEISIHVSESDLRRHGLSFDELQRIVRQASIEQPGGSIETDAGEMLIRTRSQRYVADEFARIPIFARPDGSVLRLGQIASVTDDFERTDQAARFDGEQSIMLNVFRVGEQDAVDVADTVKRYVDHHRAHLGEHGVSIATWFDMSEIIRSRVNLLLRNGIIGLMLVFLCLALFVDLRLAVWATVAIPVSILGAFWLLPQLDVTINIISMFAMIMVLGIVVDDAVVIGENIFTHRQRGLGPLDAAVAGAREMAVPIVIAVATTMVAFVPILFVTGHIGQLNRTLPLVVITVLGVSLIEALLILPAHLAGGHSHMRPRGRIAAAQQSIRSRLDWFIRGPYTSLLRSAVAWRYVTMAAGVGLLLITVGMIQGGHLRFVFFPEVEADNVVASVLMPQGTPRPRTEQVVARIEAAAERIAQEIDAERPGNQPSTVRHIATNIGTQPFAALMEGDGGMRGVVGVTRVGGHVAEVNVELLGADHRDIASAEFARRWREQVGEITEVAELTFSSSLFKAGNAVEVELTHTDFEQTLAAADRLKQRLADFRGTSGISVSHELGNTELQLELKPHAAALSVREAELARQVRQAFHGSEVQRLQRGRDEVKVMLRYPTSERRSIADLKNMRVRLPDGRAVPLRTIATINTGRGYAKLDRADRKRIVRVTAEVDQRLTSPNAVNTELRRGALPTLAAQFQGLEYRFEGEQREQRDALGSLAINGSLAMLVIFALLAIQFRSYCQPLIIMSAIPFGLIGAAAGHMIMRHDLSMLSMLGMVALSGVVVNNSLLLIDRINRERTDAGTLEQAIVAAATRRFRPILLTTMTTFLGLTPMILEPSLQARFLAPLAVSLGFGVLFATLITLILVPAVYIILEDLHVHRLRHAASSTRAGAPDLAVGCTRGMGNLSPTRSKQAVTTQDLASSAVTAGKSDQRL